MPALSTLKGNRTRAKTALVRQEAEANELLQRDTTDADEHQINQLCLLVGKVTLNLETKLTRLEVANDKLADAYEAAGNTESARQFETVLEEDGEFIDNIIGRVSQLRTLKEELERKRRELASSHTQGLERRLTQIQEQVTLIQSSRNTEELSSIWIPSLPVGSIKPPHLDMPTFAGDVLKWKEFWDMFNAAIHSNEKYANIDKFNCLKSKLSGDALQAISGYQLSNENYPVVVDVLKHRFGNKQLIIDAHYHNLSHLSPATNQVNSLRQCYDAIEQSLRSLEALGEEVNHRHFVALICEKLPQRVLYQLYMLKDEGEDWTVPKLRQLLGKHISALEMAAGTEFPHTSAHMEGSRQMGYSEGHKRPQPVRPTASGLLSGQNKGAGPQKPRQIKCVYCGQPHWSDECTKFSTLQARREKLKGYCFVCLRKGHVSRNCDKETTCAHCGRKRHHHRSLCPKLFTNSEESRHETELSSVEQASDGPKKMVTSVLMQTATAVVRNVDKGSSSKIRLILDSGSQRTYITKGLANELKLKLSKPEELSVVTFGVNQPKNIQCQSSELQLILKDESIMTLNVKVVPSITGKITRFPLDVEDLEFLKQEGWEKNLADSLPTNTETSHVEMLIGNDYYFDLLKPRKIHLGDNLFAFQTKLGWVFGGRTQVADHGTVDIPVCTALMPLAKPDLERFWNLESLGINDSLSISEDDIALEKFNKSVTFMNGRYMVTWPWREDDPDLPENYQLALGRLKSILQRLVKIPTLLEKYDAIIKEQLNKGIIERITDDSRVGPLKHYIPHHPVITPLKATTKVRVVYDASAKTQKGNKSLNECLYRGPVILPSLFGLLLRFRLNPIGIVSDVEKAFLNIGLQMNDRDVTRFLWLKDATSKIVTNNIQVYRFCRIPFGVVSSPFLLGATVAYHLQKCNNPLATKIQHNVYVDNIITGAQTITEAKALYSDTKQMFAEASMNLREWASNSAELMAFIPVHDRADQTNLKVLGIRWNLGNDTLSIPGLSDDRIENIFTKREILKVVASIFDPLGYFAPTILQAKLFIQELWADKLEWDTEFQPESVNRWKQICENLKAISSYYLPRYLGLIANNDLQVEYTLVCFCDASTKAYALTIYLHQASGDNCKADLLLSKTRLAPQKVTVPRLELLGVLIGIRALKSTLKEINLPIKDKILYTDSQCVLHWLQTKKPLSVFVINRLKEIKSLEGTTFRYIPTQENPADLATRGKSPFELSSSIWWNGPAWLSQPQSQWPEPKVPDFNQSSLEVSAEVTGPKVLFEAKLVAAEDPVEGLKKVINLSDIKIKKFSSLQRLLRITAWVIRVANKFMKREISTESLTVQEIEKARLLWDRYVQEKCYADVIKNIRLGRRCNLKEQLNLIIDDHGLLRCRGRYENAELTQGARCPKLLSATEYYTRLIIEDCHYKTMHSGVSQTLAQTRMGYWIPQGRSQVKKVVNNCKVCQRAEGGSFSMPKMPPWPRERVAQSFPFEYTGLDYLGPFYIQVYTRESNQPTSKKVWVCLFTCLAVRAMHLELIEDLSAQEFLLGLRRFIARRGTPRQIVSDNAKQFKTASTVLNKAWSEALTSSEVQDYAVNQGIQWRFIVNLAPWMGGFYERLVGLTKRALRKTIGMRSLTERQLITVLTEVEAVVNSRPLVYVDSDINSSLPISPLSFLSLNHNHFILDFASSGEDTEFKMDERLGTAQQLLERWKRGQRCLTQFWEMWRNNYLLALRERTQLFHKKAKGTVKHVPKIGDVVLLKEKLPRGQWRIGRIVKLIEGRDQLVRSARVRLSSKTILTRALNMLYPIECPDQDNVTVSAPVERTQGNNDDNDTSQEDVVEEDMNSLENGDDSTPTTPSTRSTRQAVVAAREKIRKWLNPVEDSVGVGNVADHAN